MKKVCAVEGCGADAASRGYCQKHYMRLHRHGSVEAGRPDWYGSKSSHPMYITWMSAKRGKSLCDAWAADFWKFLEDVSPVPEGNWRLRRRDDSLPYSKENVFWKEVLVSKRSDETNGAYHYRRYKAIYKGTSGDSSSPEKLRVRSLRNNHGMTVELYEQMHAAQNGLCAICGKPETKARSNGVTLPLAIDHCHKTRQGGKSKGIRGLLCQACNIGLGKFDDEPELLRKAAAYLEKYRS
jgi:hypothetical protein